MVCYLRYLLSFQEKSENILISYIVYIKEQTERDPSLINMEELGASAMLKTNKGLQNPSKVPIHFTPEYKNSINLQAVLPGKSKGKVFIWLYS